MLLQSETQLKLNQQIIQNTKGGTILAIVKYQYFANGFYTTQSFLY